jgi:hypothetical protein
LVGSQAACASGGAASITIATAPMTVADTLLPNFCSLTIALSPLD